MRRALWMRFAAALLVLGAVHVYVDRQWHWAIAGRILDVGEAVGMSVSRLSGHVIAPRPFQGEGWWADAWNFVYDHGPRAWALMVAWAAGAGVFWFVGQRGGGPTRDGRTRCGWCGYVLEGLKEPRCPECGREI